MKPSNLVKYKFKCKKCGNCCYDVVRDLNYEFYSHDFRGNLKLRAKKSVSVHHMEKSSIESTIKMNII